jgi:hypothetical protein
MNIILAILLAIVPSLGVFNAGRSVTRSFKKKKNHPKPGPSLGK